MELAHTAMVKGGGRWWGTVKMAGLVAYSYCLWHTVTTHIFSYIVCDGDSMFPTVNGGERNEVFLVEFWSTKLTKLNCSDIVIAKQPDRPSLLICKRIIAMEGDDIPPSNIPCKYCTVPKGHVWLEGDNPDSSYDSRDFGPLPYSLIQSRVFFRIWPPARIGVIR